MNKRGRIKNDWNPVTEGFLKRRFAEGGTCREIAEEMQSHFSFRISQNGIRQKLSRLNLWNLPATGDYRTSPVDYEPSLVPILDLPDDLLEAKAQVIRAKYGML